MHEEFPGPYWSADMIGVNGKLVKHYKGGPSAPAAPPPPVRETNRNTAGASEAERLKASMRRGYASTLNPKEGSLLAPGQNAGGKTLLG